jgi:hypothetical protein
MPAGFNPDNMVKPILARLIVKPAALYPMQGRE